MNDCMTPREREDFRRYRDELDYNPDKLIDNMAPIIYHKNLNMKPEIIYCPTCTPEIDHIATGAAAKAYRVSKRVLLREIAPKLGFSEASGPAHMESGRIQWTPEKHAQYVAAVDSVIESK